MLAGRLKASTSIFTQGIGPDAGHRAGWYNHYGRVWVLKNAQARATSLARLYAEFLPLSRCAYRGYG